MDQTDSTGETVEKPSLTEEEARRLIEERYGFKVKSLRPMNSYIDLNFHVKVEDDVSWPYGYTLKVTNGTFSRNRDVFEAQTQMTTFLEHKGFPVPQAVPNLRGEVMSLESLRGNDNGPCSENMVRLSTYLPGSILYDVPMTLSLAYDSGVFLAKVQEALQDFFHPALRRPDNLWSLAGLPSLVKYLHCLKDERIKDEIRKIVHTFGEKVLSRMDELPQGAVHGDFNDQNVLVEEEPTHPGKYRICGLLDFDLIIFNPYVFDLAVGLMYLMSAVRDPNDPITFGGHFLAGFESVRALTPVEWDVLYYCVVARALQSYVFGHHTASIYPENREYLMVTAGGLWKLIDRWWGTPKEEIYKQWRDIQKSLRNQSNGSLEF
ncbi:hydroxylysine kinase-like isoform X1 [Branchiostoma lanceolatum]|uniref:hydroxylysine kinase-like isoform X1 n=1 Tax=Branchiostoma lanceolatum TaxID=7740 RepID=UPI003456977B